jgi:chorismate--pyruvate lyase
MAQPADLHPAGDDTGRTARLRVWRPAGGPDALPEDPVLADWLTDPGSLTRRLRRVRGEGFEFAVLREGWEPSTASDRGALGIDDAAVYVRRIRMGLSGRALVHARTVAPAATLRRHPWLTELGASPLGEVLSRRTRVWRSPFEYAPAAAQGRGQEEAGLWGRRSRFVIDGAPLLVYEFLCPALAGLGPGT